MAVRAYKNRYKGAIIGGFWLTITTAMTAIGLGLLYGKLFGAPIAAHLPYVTLGIVTWAAISAYATSGCEVFTSSSAVFKDFPMPLSLFPYRLLITQMIYFGYRSIVLLAILVIFRQSVAPTAPLAIFGIALVFWIGFWASFALGVVNARYRDFGQMVAAATTFFIFVTPIFWRADRLGDFSWVVDFNPFYHLINTVRGPILGEPGIAVSFIVATLIAAVVPFVAFYLFGRFSNRLAYWC